MRRNAGMGLAMLALMAACATAGSGDAAGTHAEGESIRVTTAPKQTRIATFGTDRSGNLLVCDRDNETLIVLTPAGKETARWKPGLAPEAVHVHTDGTIFVGGRGKLARLDAKGKVIRTGTCPGDSARTTVAGIATSKTDLFVTMRVGFSFAVVRFTHDLGEPKQIVDRLRGCCGQMHIVAKDGVIYAAENARKRVVRYDREGKELGAWGKDGREGLEGFGSCCNPMNLCFGPGGALYTSESQGRVKRYTPDGKLLGLVGLPKLGGGCMNVAVDTNADGSRVYVLDRTHNLIRVLAKR